MIQTEPDLLFPPAFLARLESLALLARQMVRTRRRADRRSVQRGASVEFAEYRPFVSGDDYRHIDWNAFARWRHLVLKLFVEEEDLHVHLLLDCSQSMGCSAPSKFDYARQLAAGLAYMALANLDRAAVAPLGSESYGLWAASRGRHRFLQMLRYLARCPLATTPTPLEDLVRRWVGNQPQRGMVIWISDLFGSDTEDALKALDRLRYARHELAVIQVMAPEEKSAGENGEWEIEDVETGTRQKVLVDPGMARTYKERFEQYQAALSAYCRRYQVPLLHVDTTMKVDDVLTRSLMTEGFVR